MEPLLNNLHPPGWTILQTVGTGAALWAGTMVARFVAQLLTRAGALAREKR